MTVFLILFAAYTVGVLVGWVGRSHRAHVLGRRRKLADHLRNTRPTAPDARALVERVDVGMWDADIEAALPPELRRRSTA